MKVIQKETIVVTCNNCNAMSQTDSLDDFRESNTYPPSAYFICPACEQLAKLDAQDMPPRLFTSLVGTIAKERGHNCDREIFNRLKTIEG